MEMRHHLKWLLLATFVIACSDDAKPGSAGAGGAGSGGAGGAGGTGGGTTGIAVITGKVTAHMEDGASMGTPIAGAAVQLQVDQDGDGAISDAETKTATTDAAGDYRLELTVT